MPVEECQVNYAQTTFMSPQIRSFSESVSFSSMWLMCLCAWERICPSFTVYSPCSLLFFCISCVCQSLKMYCRSPCNPLLSILHAVERELDNISLDSTTIFTPEVAHIDFERVESIRSIASVKKEGSCISLNRWDYLLNVVGCREMCRPDFAASSSVHINSSCGCCSFNRN